jgi:hypothetical protein
VGLKYSHAKVIFMPIGSFNVNTISYRTCPCKGREPYTLWFRLIMSEGLATLLAGALRTLTTRTAQGTLTPRVIESGPYIYPAK